MPPRSRRPQQHLNLSIASDHMLCELTRDGVQEAFGELWIRHSGAVFAATRSFTGYEADDLVQEAFTRVYESIMRGDEPPASFRAYVAQASRRIAIDMARKQKGVSVDPFEDELDELYHPEAGDFSDAIIEDSTTASAFTSLTAREREVLWYRDVEDLPVHEVARYIGMSENSTTVCIKRAREAFKAAWIGIQLSPQRNLPEECSRVVAKLPRYARGKLAPREHAKIELHLMECVHCAIVSSEANSLHKQLALVLLPLLVFGGAPGYLQWVESERNRAPLPAQANLLPVSVQRGATRVATTSGATAGILGISAFPKPAFALAASLAGLLFLGAATGALVSGALGQSDVSSQQSTEATDTGAGADRTRTGADHTAAPGTTERGAAASGTGGTSRTTHPAAQQLGSTAEFTAQDSAGSASTAPLIPVVSPEAPSPAAPGVIPSAPEPPITPAPQPPTQPEDPDGPLMPPNPTTGGESDPGDDPDPVVYPAHQVITAELSASPFGVQVLTSTPGATVSVYVQIAEGEGWYVSAVSDAAGRVFLPIVNDQERTVDLHMIQEFLQPGAGHQIWDEVVFMGVLLPVTP